MLVHRLTFSLWTPTLSLFSLAVLCTWMHPCRPSRPVPLLMMLPPSFLLPYSRVAAAAPRSAPVQRLHVQPLMAPQVQREVPPLMCSSRSAHLSAHPPPPVLEELHHRLQSHLIPSKAKPTRPPPTHNVSTALAGKQNASPLPSSQLPEACTAAVWDYIYLLPAACRQWTPVPPRREHNPSSVKQLAPVTNHSRNLCLTFCRWCVLRIPNPAGMAPSKKRQRPHASPVPPLCAPVEPRPSAQESHANPCGGLRSIS